MGDVQEVLEVKHEFLRNIFAVKKKYTCRLVRKQQLIRKNVPPLEMC